MNTGGMHGSSYRAVEEVELADKVLVKNADLAVSGQCGRLQPPQR